MELSEIKDDNLLDLDYVDMDLDELLQYKERLIRYSNYVSFDITVLNNALSTAIAIKDKKVKKELTNQLVCLEQLKDRIKLKIANASTQIKLLKHSV